jgi:DNA-binding beta-propeller fold protein YncE
VAGTFFVCGGVGTGPGAIGPWGIAFDGTHMWVTLLEGDEVVELNPDGSLDHRVFPVSSKPIGIAFDGTHMWVTNSGSDTVTELNPDGSVAGVGPFPVGNTPVGIAFDGANHVWVANNGSDNVTEIKTT